MALTIAAQLQALKADILANTGTIPAGQPWTDALAGVAINAIPDTGVGNAVVAAYYNQPAAPAWTIWRKNVTILEVGNNLNGAELGGLSSLNHTRLQTVVMLSQLGIDASLADRRQFFDDIFSGSPGATTRAQLLVLWKRIATRAQKLFSTGPGSDAFPATTANNVGDGFLLSPADVLNAFNS
jgi:hypothetical protein